MAQRLATPDASVGEPERTSGVLPWDIFNSYDVWMYDLYGSIWIYMDLHGFILIYDITVANSG